MIGISEMFKIKSDLYIIILGDRKLIDKHPIQCVVTHLDKKI